MELIVISQGDGQHYLCEGSLERCVAHVYDRDDAHLLCDMYNARLREKKALEMGSLIRESGVEL